MDELNNLHSQRINIPEGESRPAKIVKYEENDWEEPPETVNQENTDTDYAAVVGKQELLCISKAFNKANPQNSSNYVTGTLNDRVEDSKQKMDEIYQKYNFNIAKSNNKNLTILKDRDNIMRAISNNPVVVLQGETGCGKSTQLPQMILEDAHFKYQFCNIIVTQPRRIAAINVAKQVAIERECNVGSLVGYQIGLDACANEDTRIMYCTTGVLLLKLINNRSLNLYTHIVLDEVHERSEDMDFLMIVVRKLLWRDSPHVKIILMSATIDADIFSKYFMIPRRDNLLAPIIKVNSGRIYQVTEFYIDDIRDIVNPPNISISEPTIEDEMYLCALKLCYICHRIDKGDSLNDRASILVFLPGVPEIERMKEFFNSDKSDNKIEFKILMLHSRISRDEQQKVFQKSKNNQTKVILATNIAESSITLTDVKYVIDFCLTKSNNIDRETNFPVLTLEWASRNNCRQRSGRAGRVSNGRVYRLVTKDFYHNQMSETNVCELVRCPLENVVLKAKCLDMGKPAEIIGLAMNPPKLDDIKKTILVLKEAGALLKYSNGKYDDCDGDLTYIGSVMSQLPLHISLSKLIIFGSMFSLLNESITIAAALAGKHIFTHSHNNKFEIYCNKLRWANGSGSDCVAILNAYTKWIEKRRAGKLDYMSSQAFAKHYLLEIKALQEMEQLIYDLKGRLKKCGLMAKQKEYRHYIKWSPTEVPLILNIILAGAFYPNYFIPLTKGGEESNSEIYSEVGDLDPCNTVYFKGFDSEFIGPLYSNQIKDIFKRVVKSPDDIQLKFPVNAQKIYVTFPNTNNEVTGEYKHIIPGTVAAKVFKSIKLRNLNNNSFQIKVFKPTEARTFVERHNIGTFNNGVWTKETNYCKDLEMYPIPPKNIKEIKGYVTKTIDCNHFWFQLKNVVFRNICNDLREADLYKFSNKRDISIGLIVAVEYSEVYCRGKITNININGSGRYEVELIDFAIYVWVEYEEICKLRGLEVLQQIPPQILRCTLTECQPSTFKSRSGHWANEAKSIFENLCKTKNRSIVAEVYSVVNSVCSVILYNGRVNINDMMLKSGFAESVNESFMSQKDHDYRVKAQISGILNSKQADIKKYLDSSTFNDDTIITPREEELTQKIFLKGPFSSLETSVIPILRSTKTKTVCIENDSVNSVLLDTNLNDNYEKMLISASISNAQNSSKIILRNTTLMPHIRGLGPILGLLFAPCAELRRNISKSHYVNLLCGLGFNKQTNAALFEEHDLLFNLDTEINEIDIQHINRIRFHINKLIHIEPNEIEPSLSEEEKIVTKGQLKEDILELLTKTRNFMTVQYDNRNEYKWNSLEQDELIQVQQAFVSPIYQLHEFEALQAIDHNAQMALHSHCDNLHRLSRQLSFSGNETVNKTCKLCSIDFESDLSFRLHVTSLRHRQKEIEIGYTKPKRLF